MSDDETLAARDQLTGLGLDLATATAEDLRHTIIMQGEAYRDEAPMTAAEAATIILAGVRQKNGGSWSERMPTWSTAWFAKIRRAYTASNS